MVFGNGVKNIQAAAYNGARTVYNLKNVIARKLFGLKVNSQNSYLI